MLYLIRDGEPHKYTGNHRKGREQLANEPNLSPALKTTFDLLIDLCLLLAQKGIPKNSSNSSIPPSADPNRKKTSRAEGKRKPGGQAGHPGATLKPDGWDGSTGRGERDIGT
jgi:transposase